MIIGIRQTLGTVLPITLLFVLVSAICAGQREGTTARVFIEVAKHSPCPKELGHRDILANARLHVPSGRHNR